MSAKARIVAAIGAATVAGSATLILKFEGTVFHTYRDPIGIITSCTGHTGPELKPGQKFTKAECDEQLYQDMLKHAAALKCVTVPLSDNERAAYLSFAFNVGNGAFCKSTLVRILNTGDHRGACAQLSRWTRAGGRELTGLVRRRAAERKLCETP